ncbi:hypothetical protein BDR07DRAFT_1374756 [Suillus spraguei]|nr:hypothetical protein BDR07DRAFT_1374756 [Suillus spraguei]
MEEASIGEVGSDDGKPDEVAEDKDGGSAMQLGMKINACLYIPCIIQCPELSDFALSSIVDKSHNPSDATQYTAIFVHIQGVAPNASQIEILELTWMDPFQLQELLDLSL